MHSVTQKWLLEQGLMIRNGDGDKNTGMAFL